MIYSLRIKPSFEPTSSHGAEVHIIKDEITVELEPEDSHFVPQSFSDDDLEGVVQYQVLPTKQSSRAFYWVTTYIMQSLGLLSVFTVSSNFR